MGRGGQWFFGTFCSEVAMLGHPSRRASHQVRDPRTVTNANWHDVAYIYYYTNVFTATL